MDAEGFCHPTSDIRHLAVPRRLRFSFFANEHSDDRGQMSDVRDQTSEIGVSSDL
jgi:hypothetical protein